ncbi:MAG: SDR family oxidoreductase, partial [Caldilinea sp.]
IDPSLTGKTAIVTGANHGIGAATARALAAQGVRIFLTCYRDPVAYTDEELAQARTDGVGGDVLYRAMQQQPVEVVVEAIRAAGGKAEAWSTDLGDPASIPLLFDRCEATFGPVDILVANHTYCVLETFDPELVSDAESGVFLPTAEVIDRHFAVNSRAVALLIHEFTQRYLRRRAPWGRIITVSTDAAHAHTANISYAASKHAIESYSRSAAAELGRYGITVNVVAPGPIQTGYITPENETAINAGTPLGRLGAPEDVADVVVFLASEQARWLTGQLLYVGGGWRMPQ